MRLLATSGVPVGLLFTGKALGLAAGLGALLIPAVAVGALVVALAGEGPAPASRLAALLVTYLAYFALFLALTLGISARAGSSRAALIALLGAWVVSALVMPRATADLAALISPTPSATAIAGDVRASLADGLPDGPPREERIEEITDALLEEQGFKGAETLMDAALLGGIELQAEAQFENEVIDFHYARLADATERQEAVVEWMGVLAPPIAIQALSSGFAGTDFAHHRHFSDAAEGHRRALIDMLNREFAEKGGSDAWSYRASRDTWARAPAFRYDQPGLDWVLARRKVSLGVLAGWLLGAFGLAIRAARRMPVV